MSRTPSKVTVIDASRRQGVSRKPSELWNGAVYLSTVAVELYSFDEAYLRRLQARDSATENHFFDYFNELLRIKLRSRRLSASLIDDVCQETFKRVLEKVQVEGEIRYPERLGAYVNSTCKNILLETYRGISRHQHVDVDTVEVPDLTIDLENMVFVQENKKAVRAILARLPKRDRDILCALALEERDKDEVCREFGVDRNYLRVLLHRAKNSFRAQCKSRKSKSHPGQGADTTSV